MITQTINGNEILLVTVPEDAIKFKISGLGYPCFLDKNEWHVAFPESVDCVIIGKASDLTEQQWQGIVRELPVGERYENYLGDYPIWHHSAKASGLSLLKSRNLDPKTTLVIVKK